MGLRPEYETTMTTREQDGREEEIQVPMHPIQMMPENTLLFMARSDEQVQLECDLPEQAILEPEDVCVAYHTDESDDTDYAESDEVGRYVELCFTKDMSSIILDEYQFNHMEADDVATMRVYVTADAKRAVVVKEDDLLSKKDFATHGSEITTATIAELRIWLENSCFKQCLLKDAKNVMTSRYVAKWKKIKNKDGSISRVIRMRMCLRGFMDTEAFSLDTFSGTAKRASQRILASEAACHADFIMASLDIDKAFLKGFTYKELAEATGEHERMVCFKLPPGSAALLRKFPGFANFDESIHCLQCIKPGTGTKDAPRAFSLKLRRTTKCIGLKSMSYDAEFEIKKDLLTAKHVDDINMAGREAEVDHYVAEVEKVFGKCKLNKKQFTNCGVQYTQNDNGDIILDQDGYISTLRPIMTPELTGAAAEHEATKNVADMFVSLRGALAYTTLTQAWIQVYIVALQRVQVPTNLDVRRLNAVTRKLQKTPQKTVFPFMKCAGKVDLHTDSGYRRMEQVDDVKGYGMRELCLLRRGEKRDKSPAVHLLDSICRSHRLTIRSSYGAETLAAAHGFDDAFPTLVTVEELKRGVLDPTELKMLREQGGLKLSITLTTDAESVYKSLTSRDLRTPAEKTLLGHVSWIREMLQVGLVDIVQWCDTRDMTADGHTKGCIDRELLLQVMSGRQVYRHAVKQHSSHRGTR